MKRLRLPKVQYTFREISCGIQFLGFAKCSLSYSRPSFLLNTSPNILKDISSYILEEDRKPDNGSEYCGSWSATKPSAYTLTVESVGQIHQTIPPGTHRFQSDIETVHNLI